MLKRFPRALSMGAAVFVVLLSVATAASANTLYVSPKGKNKAACTKHRPCKTIRRAVKRAKTGDTVSVGRGTYREAVTLSKRIWLVGTNNPVIDARGKTNGVLITGGGAAGATVRGFKVQNANFEGILAQRTSSVTIARNTVQQNDQGLKSSHPTGECAAAGPIPGDCGEGVHLLSVTLASVSNNTVQDNAGGILLTDELGPTAFNVISGNKALNNVLDCGITLASHNVKAAPGGVPQPSAAGVYDNYIVNNTANGNGTKGEGGGILIAGPAPGTASYNNVVNGNTANDNGLAGITLHSHTPQQDFNGNVITNNRVSHDGISGNNGGPGDSDFGVKNTVGILLGSTVDTLQGTVVANNTISNVFFGIWTMNVPKINTPNTFIGVTAPLTQT